MNQIIIDNQQKIGSVCQLCFSELDKYNKNVQAFHEKRNAIVDSPAFSQIEKERRINEAHGELCNAAQRHYEEIKGNLNIIRSAAKEMENLLDIGEDLQNALAVIKTLGKDLPIDSRVGMVNQFKGQKRALIILKAALESVDIPTSTYFENLIFDADSAINELDDDAYRLASQPGNDPMVFIHFGNKLEKLAKSLGVTLVKSFRNAVDTSDAFSRHLRAVMGAGVSDR